ncbi:unnamed protein product [Cuscuta epithymum]|uniref:Uncharacterized protein n=1 Tax=Cuscuta epithymum TaxID=186058 RepID=A0AAV0CC60_9ASTE|nr:unnamed protein product [Cuscuta epithymum]
MEFGLFKNLKVLDFSDNSLSGQIPYTLGNLSKLTHLDLSDNKFTGYIPPSLGNYNNLTLFVAHTNPKFACRH